MGREVGGWFRMGNTCTPMVDSCQCMAKPIQYCKVKKKKKRKPWRYRQFIHVHKDNGDVDTSCMYIKTIEIYVLMWR